MELQADENVFVWVSASTSNDVHLCTELVHARPRATWQHPAMLEGSVNVSLTAVRNGGYTLLGTAVVRTGVGDGPRKAVIELWQCVDSRSTKRSVHHIVITMPEGMTVEVVTPEPCRCEFKFAEQTWPTPVCVGAGCSWLSATDNIDSTDVLAERWDAYCDCAAQLLNDNCDDLDILLATTLQRSAGKYMHEKVDNRGPPEITFCWGHDCDSQAMAVLLFTALMMEYQADVDVKNRKLLNYLCSEYAGPLLCTGMARAPRAGKHSKPFGHAWAALRRKGIDPQTPLQNCLLVEATAPICPKPGTHAGVLLTDEVTAREKQYRKLAPHAPQIVVAVRENLPWYYGDMWSVYGPDFTVDYCGRSWQAACEGVAGRTIQSCCKGRAFRSALHPRVTRSPAQLPHALPPTATTLQLNGGALAATVPSDPTATWLDGLTINSVLALPHK